MVPFIVFEYYLILFEHIFVDTSHFMSSLASMAFISQSPGGGMGSKLNSQQHLKESQRGSHNHLKETEF
jgi:hypothetical protein